MKKSILSLLFLFGVAASAYAETIELVTYYPAPGGQEVDTPRLHARAGTIGPPYSLINPAALPNGTLLVAGPVGIGPDFAGLAPTERLEVEGNVLATSAAGSALFKANRAANNIPNGLQVLTNRVAQWTIGSRAGAEDLHLFSDRDNATRLFIQQGTGNVGVGTAAPTDRLQVVGGLGQGITSGSTDAGQLNIAIGQANIQARSGVNFSPLALNAAGGNVGIGTNAPGVRLDVAQNTAIRVGNAYLCSGRADLASFSSNAWRNAAAWTIPNAARRSGLLQFQDQALYFYQTQTAGAANWAGRFCIDPNGRVGVGTFGPRHPLEVAGGAQLTLFGWAQGLLLSAGTALAWDRGGQANFFFMAHPSGQPAGDFWAGFAPALNAATPPTYVYRVIIGSGDATAGTVQFFNPIIAAGAPFPSDERLKSGVVPLTGVLERVCAMQPVSFEWNDQYEALGYKGTKGKRSIGLLGQQVERAFPEVVSYFGDQHYRMVDYSRLTTVLVGAVREQQSQIRALQSQNDALKERIKALERKGD